MLQTPTGTSQTPVAGLQSTAPLKAGDLISKMFERYTNALTISGTIHMVQEALGKTVTADSELDYERPNKIYLRQEERGNEVRNFLLTSDGKTFSYDKPKFLHGPARCVEYTKTRTKVLDLGEMYTAAGDSVIDANQLLNVAIGRRVDLVNFTERLSSFRIAGSTKVGKETIYQVVGKYAFDPKLPAAADYVMEISEDGDFKRFVVKQLCAVPGHPDMAPIMVTMSWVGNLSLDTPPNPALFKTIN